MVDKSSMPEDTLSAELHAVLMALGRALGIIAVYGTDHPSAEKAIESTFSDLQALLKKSGTVALGSIKGELTVNGKPVTAKDAPIKALEKRLAAIHISHLALNKGLSAEEFKKLLAALCAGTDQQVKETLSKSGMAHVDIEDVKYVALRKGETKVSKGRGSGTGEGGTKAGQDDLPSVQVNQIVAFLKGDPSGETASPDVKKMLSDPEKLGQMIMEAAAVRQVAASLEGGESLADIVVGCLRRTYDGMRKESEFETARGKATLAKTMLLLEKTIIEKLRGPAGAESPGLDRRIMAGIREMEKERQFDVLSTHYVEQCQKQSKAEEKIVGFIQQQGVEKSREQLAASDIPFSEWQRLMVQSGDSSLSGGPGGGADMSVIATALEKLGGLMQTNEPEEAKAAVNDARREINNYTSQIESQIDEMEEKVKEREGKDQTKRRENLVLEISKLTLSLMQPLAVINGSIEAALTTANEALHKDLLDLAYQSGQSMQEMTKRMITLVGYPTLSEADGHLNEWKESS